MFDMKHTLTAGLAVAFMTGSTSAAVVFQSGYTGTATETASAGAGGELDFAGDVSSSDLINGTGSFTGFATSNGASAAQLTDGVHGDTFASAGNQVQGAWADNGNEVAVFDLGSGANGLGYDITSILSIAAWVNVGFGDQAWTVEVRALGGSYETLATVDYDGTTDGGATKVELSGLNASGIDAIRFTASQVNGGANGGGFVWRELDVFGASTAPIPEPGSLALMGLGGLCVLRRRRQNP